MKKDFSRLRHQQKEEAIAEQQQEQKSEAKEFSSVEEVLRLDLVQTEVPSAIAVKLNQSMAKLPPREDKSWWQRFFSRE